MADAPGTVAICAAGSELETALVSDRFARCAYFHIFTSAPQGHRVIANPAAERPHGAAAMAVAALSRQGVELVYARRFGDKASEALREFGIAASATDLPCVSDVMERRAREVLHAENSAEPVP